MYAHRDMSTLGVNISITQKVAAVYFSAAAGYPSR